MSESTGKSEGRLSRWSKLKRSGEDGGGQENQPPSEDSTRVLQSDLQPVSLAPARQGSAAPVKAGLTEKGFVLPMPPLAGPEDGEAAYETAPEDALALLDAEAAALKAFPSGPEDEKDAEDGPGELTPEQVEAVRDLPPVESLNKDSDFTPFFASNVPDFLKRNAFKALWACTPFFNFRDGLDDYDENFRLIDKLITAADSDYKSGKGYGLEDEPGEDDDDLGDGEDEGGTDDGDREPGEEQIAAADEENPEDDAAGEAEPEIAKEPRKSDVRPPDDAV
jgi:hypothetical protein